MTVKTILFLCTGNSCRSIMAEAIFNHIAPAGWQAMSAGSKPTGQVHPRTLALLEGKGIGTEGYYSKSWDNLPTIPDVVVTVCNNAANEVCPAYLGKAERLHWDIADPAAAKGSAAQIEAVFEETYDTLSAHIEALLSELSAPDTSK